MTMSDRIVPPRGFRGPRGPHAESDSTRARAAALRLAQDDSAFCAADVLTLEPDLGAVTVQVVLSKLASAKMLSRVAHGFYARPGVFPENTSTQAGPTTMARGENAAAARALEAADAWLKECPPLPAARPPAFDAPRSRHGGVR